MSERVNESVFSLDVYLCCCCCCCCCFQEVKIQEANAWFDIGKEGEGDTDKKDEATVNESETPRGAAEEEDELFKEFKNKSDAQKQREKERKEEEDRVKAEQAEEEKRKAEEAAAAEEKKRLEEEEDKRKAAEEEEKAKREQEERRRRELKEMKDVSCYFCFNSPLCALFACLSRKERQGLDTCRCCYHCCCCCSSSIRD